MMNFLYGRICVRLWASISWIFVRPDIITLGSIVVTVRCMYGIMDFLSRTSISIPYPHGFKNV
jgi:hypothetical protein